MKLTSMILITATLTAASAQAAAVFNTGYATTMAVTASNNFQAELAGLGYSNLSNTAVVTLSERTRVRFEVLGSQDGAGDGFVTLSKPNLSYTQAGSFANYFAAPVLIGAATFDVGLLTAQFLGAVNARPGQPGFGVYLPLADAPGQYFSQSLVFGFDQSGGIGFDNLIVRATIAAVPEPASWTMMLTGFGLLGTAMRRRATIATAVPA